MKGLIRSQTRRCNPILKGALKSLREFDREFTLALDRGQIGLGHSAYSQLISEQVCGDDCILDGNVDAHARHRRHRVGCVADE